jgi:hypothetical protein
LSALIPVNVTLTFLVLSIRSECGTRIRLDHCHAGKRLIRVQHFGIPVVPDRLPLTLAWLIDQPQGEYYECFDIEMDQAVFRSQPPEIKNET